MKYFSVLFLFFFFNSVAVFSQEKHKQHTVARGETISEIAKKYAVNPSAIYELNPDAVNGIKWKAVLLIPINAEKTKSSSASKNFVGTTHEVLPKETIYGIAKEMNISVADLYLMNPNLEKDGLKIGQSIKVPQTDLDKNITIPADTIAHEVLAKESLYSIAKKYGITLTNLQKANPELANKSIKVGQKINVPAKSAVNSTIEADKISAEKQLKSEKQNNIIEKPIVEDKKVIVEKTIAVVNKTSDEIKNKTNLKHEVLAKESLYSIAKKYGTSLAALREVNSELGNKSIKVGQKINVPSNAVFNLEAIVEKGTDEKQVTKEKEILVRSDRDREEKKSEVEIIHEVLPKETKYGIAKQYGLTMIELENQNPSIATRLLVGSKLKIRSSKALQISPSAVEVVVEEKKTEEIQNQNPIVARDAAFVDQLISRASANIGTRYRSGGTTTAGFDCSGLMCYTFADSDIKLPRSSAEMAIYGSKIETENAQKGDLIFFKTRGSSRINHVGMVVEVLDGEIKFIHAATHGGVIISSTKESYYEKNFAQVNRVL